MYKFGFIPHYGKSQIFLLDMHPLKGVKQMIGKIRRHLSHEKSMSPVHRFRYSSIGPTSLDPGSCVLVILEHNILPYLQN